MDTLSGLDIICAQFVICLWVAAVFGTAALLTLHRGRGVARLVLHGAGVVPMVLLAAAASVNAYYAYLPTAGDVGAAMTSNRQWVPLSGLTQLSPMRLVQAQHQGLVAHESVPPDPLNGFAGTESVIYLPPQYFLYPSQRFPVVYLFHGSPGQPADWMHAGRAQRVGAAVAALGRPVIMVAPRMSHAWTDDPECVDGKREKVETHLISRVIPLTDATLRTMPVRTERIFAGMSAGGYCALNLGLRHRNLVSTIIDMSGDTEPTHTGGAFTLFGANDPDSAALVAANAPQRYASALNPSGAPERIWLDSGTHDTAIVHHMAALTATLRSRGFDLAWRIRPGGHTYWVWRAALSEALPWALGLPDQHARPGSRPGPRV